MRTDVPDELREALQFMLDDLQGNALEVIKIPGRDGEGLVRVVVGKNAEWYQSFCAEHQTNGRGDKAGQWHNKRHGKMVLPTQAKDWKHRRISKAGNDTVIKRQYTIKLIQTMLRRGHSASKYAGSLLDHAQDIKEDWDHQEQQWTESQDRSDPPPIKTLEEQEQWDDVPF